MGSSSDFRVVIAGGGVAALESALALRELGGDRFDLTLIAPEPDFVYRPLSVREPFAVGPATRFSIKDIARDLDAELIAASFAFVDRDARVAATDGTDRLHYDALILALGARPQPRYEHAITIDDAHMDELLHGLIQDVEGGFVKRLAFVVPPLMAWPLPIYELALMTARRAYDMNVELTITIVTPEPAPLAIFGSGASQGISDLLSAQGIETITSARCKVPGWNRLVIDPGNRMLDVDRVVAMPELHGPSIRGLPAAAHGFIPIDAFCKVRGAERIYAAGDGTDYALKHGGIAAQQADTAALSISALAGLPVEPLPFHPTIHAILLTGAAPRYLSATVTGGRGFSSEIGDEATWSPPTKIAARYLAPYLDRLDQAAIAGR